MPASYQKMANSPRAAGAVCYPSRKAAGWSKRAEMSGKISKWGELEPVVYLIEVQGWEGPKWLGLGCILT